MLGHEDIVDRYAVAAGRRRDPRRSSHLDRDVLARQQAEPRVERRHPPRPSGRARSPCRRRRRTSAPNISHSLWSEPEPNGQTPFTTIATRRPGAPCRTAPAPRPETGSPRHPRSRPALPSGNARGSSCAAGRPTGTRPRRAAARRLLQDVEPGLKIGLVPAIDLGLPDLAQLEPAEIGDRRVGQAAQLLRLERALAQRRHEPAHVFEQFGPDAGGRGAVRVVDLHGRVPPSGGRAAGDPRPAGRASQQKWADRPRRGRALPT